MGGPRWASLKPTLVSKNQMAALKYEAIEGLYLKYIHIEKIPRSRYFVCHDGVHTSLQPPYDGLKSSILWIMRNAGLKNSNYCMTVVGVAPPLYVTYKIYMLAFSLLHSLQLMAQKNY